MLQTIVDSIQTFLGFEQDIGDVGALQMALRTVLIYAVTLMLIRLGSKRFLDEATAFDVIVGIMLGSVMSRAINGSAPLVPTVAAGMALVGVHWLLSLLTHALDWFGPLVKGSPILLVEDGRVLQDGMRRAGLSRHDLEQALRLNVRHTDLSKVRRAYMERNGSISVLPGEVEPRVVTVAVEEGVQTVRVELR